MNVKTSFATRLKALRERQGLNQGQLAMKLGISRGSISFYENGDRIPDIETFDAICNFFGVSYDYLLGKSDLEENNIEVKAIREYTQLTEQNIELLHWYNKDYLIDVLNDIIEPLTHFDGFLIKVEEYLFYNQLLFHAREVFNMNFLKDNNISWGAYDVVVRNFVYNKIEKLPNGIELWDAYCRQEEKNETDLQEIKDKKDLLEFKISKDVFDFVIGEIEGATYTKIVNKAESYSLSDIKAHNFKSLYEEEFENYKAKQARKYGSNSEK